MSARIAVINDDRPFLDLMEQLLDRVDWLSSMIREFLSAR